MPWTGTGMTWSLTTSFPYFSHFGLTNCRAAPNHSHRSRRLLAKSAAHEHPLSEEVEKEETDFLHEENIQMKNMGELLMNLLEWK